MSYLGRSGKLSLKAQEKVSFLATAGQTSKTGLSYVPSFVEVYVNGVLLTDTTDYTATNGNSITFTVALLLNDEVTVISLKTFTVADHYSKTEADTLLAAKATNTALATKLPLAGGTMTGALFIASPNQATGGSALQIRQGNNTPYGIDMGISQTTGDLNISKVNNGTSTHMMTLGRYSGNVGVGNASPAKPLDVTGDIRTSTGILFGTDTAAANKLDDYEEGTWTSSFANSSITDGSYVKIGRMVYILGKVSCTGAGGSGTTISGLPFAPSNVAGQQGCGIVGYHNRNTSEVYSILVSQSSSTFTFRLASTAVELSAGSNFRFNLSYPTNL